MAFIASSSSSASGDDADDDPIVASYDVFLKAPLPESQKIILTRTFHKKPTAAVPEGTAKQAPPTELRIKKKTGILELDVPLDLDAPSYDRAKGLKWGIAVANSPLLKAGGSHGLAGGFGIGGPPQKVGAGRRAAQADDEAQYLDFAEAARQDKVLRHLTLGGECHPPADGAMEAYIGVFHGGELHLTPIASEVNLANQFPHLAAARETDRGKPAREAPGAAPEKEPPPARAIHMTVKSAGEKGEDPVTETMADRMRAIAIEGFERMEFVDDASDAAWAFYQDALHLRAAAAAADPRAKGKGRDRAAEPLAARVPRLRTAWDEADYLDYCRPAEQRPAAAAGGKETAAAAGGTEAAREAEPAEAPPKKNRPGRPKGSTSAKGRGAKAKAGSSRSTAVDVE